MKKEEEGKNISESRSDEKVNKVRDLSKKSKAAALGLAVFLTLSSTLVGCYPYDDEEDDDSYYVDLGGYSGGGSYYHSPGSSYKSGSWGKSSTSKSSSGKVSSSGYSGSSHSSVRGGSVGG